MAYMDKIIESEFEYLVTEKGYAKRVEYSTSLYKFIIYYKTCLEIVFIYEIRENHIRLEIWINNDDKDFVVWDIVNPAYFEKPLYKRNKVEKPVIQTIFEYVGDTWTYDSFRATGDKLYKKGKRFYEKNYPLLYKEVLLVAIENIEKAFGINP